ncbi:MAG: hypothetical protein KJI69_04890 [Patescibacteria group bacterium]|nr:hypothetical protein [Patescibacteria group bacterium]
MSRKTVEINEDDVLYSIERIGESLMTHIPYARAENVEKKYGKNVGDKKHHIRAIKEYAIVIKTLSNLL